MNKYIVLIIIAIVIETFFTPFFLHYQRPGKCKKSLACKMICATMFLLVGILAMLYSGNNSVYAKFMMTGLVFSWIGDLFLHINDKKISFCIGFVSFMTAHVFYTIGYCKSTAALFPERKLFTIAEIISIAVIEAALFLFYRFGKNINFKDTMMIAVIIYGIVLSTMTVKAVSFSVAYVNAGYENAVVAAVLLSVGAISFFMSDTSLVPLMFNEKDKKNHILKNHNIGTYFFGQTLLALSMIFINTQV